jgi:hypothetical protein
VAAALNQSWAKRKARSQGGDRSDGVLLRADDLAAVWLRDGGRCAYCGISVDLMTASFDHEVALSQGGPNLVSNLRCCCMTCQRSKYTKTADEYKVSKDLMVTCPCGVVFKPRWADYQRGYGKYHSRSCAGRAAHA